MKTAIVTDEIQKYGGAEEVLQVFLKMYPKSDLYTLFITPGARRKINKRYPLVKIHTSWNQIFIWRDKVSKYASIIKLWSNHYWENLNLCGYDLVISSSHSFGSKNIKKYRGIHISYVHTPPRFLYNEFSEIGWIKKGIFNFILNPVWNYLKKIDKAGSEGKVLLANSETVKKRIQKYYQKDAEVIYPPVKLLKFDNKTKKKNYYLCLSRLVKQKGIDLAVRVCRRNNLRLVVAGDGPEYWNLKRIAGKGITFIRNLSDTKKEKLLKEAKGLIYTSKEEDFGIVPVEAMAAGTPVIAYSSGGVKETVLEGATGILFNEFTEQSLGEAIEKFELKEWNQRRCRNQAKRFDESIFITKMKKIISRELKKGCKDDFKTIEIEGLKFSILNLKDTAKQIIDWTSIRDNKKIVFCCGLNDVVIGNEDIRIKDIINKADLITADGMPIVWKMRRYVSNKERVYGPDLMEVILSMSKNNKEIKHFLLGTTNENLKRMENELNKKYFGINITGRYSPQFCEEFDKDEVDRMVRIIEESGTNLIWIGLGGKKQIVLADMLKKRLKFGVIVTVGAAFDFLSGTKRQCPKFIRNKGGEWLYRWLNEPKRLSKRYLKIIFYLILKSKRANKSLVYNN
jgi:exopolysaccharide biosynthesis WecB/TagA/CpsF family protein